MDNNELYKQLGQNAGDINALFRDIREIKDEMKEVLNVVNKLVYWKFKVSGLAIGVAAFSSIVFNKTIGFFSRWF